MELLYALIRRFEGLFLRPYLCPAKVPTIGYGSTRYEDGSKVTMADSPILPGRAEALMQLVANAYAKEALRLSPSLAGSPGALCAIADYLYNLGATRYRASTLRKRVEAKDWEGARHELSKWVYGGGKKLPGLVARRAAESLLLPK